MPVAFLEKFDPDQPRDDHGRWSETGGGSGAIAAWMQTGEGGDVPVDPERPQAATVAEAAAKVASGRISAATGGTVRSHVEGSPVTIRAADTTADVLNEMRAKGYTMPSTVYVQRDTQPSAHGETRIVLGGGNVRTDLLVMFPAALPSTANPDDAVRIGFGSAKWTPGPKSVEAWNGERIDPARYGPNVDAFAVRNTRDLVIHEMGHVEHKETGRFTNSYYFDAAVRHFTGDKTHGAMEAEIAGRDRAARAVASVSHYALTDPGEFVAEAFVRQYRGEKLTPDAQEVYRLYAGPQVR